MQDVSQRNYQQETTTSTRDWMPKKTKKNSYALGPILMAFGLVIGIAALIGDNPIANVINPILEPITKPLLDAIQQGTQPSPSNTQKENPPSQPTPAPSSGGTSSSEINPEQAQRPQSPQRTSSSDLPPAVTSNLPQKVGSAVIFGGSVQTVELQR